MLNTILRETIEVFKPNQSDFSHASQAWRAHRATFLAVAIPVIFLSIIVNLCFICHGVRDRKTAAFQTILVVVQWAGAILYYYGNNITFIMDRYGQSLKWSNNTINENKKAANIALGLAPVFHHLLVPLIIEASHLFIGDNAKPKEENEHKLKASKYRSHSGLNMITTFLTLDVFFTLATRTWSAESCNKTGSWIFVAIVTLALVIMYSVLSCRTFCSGFGVLVLSLSLPLYLVAENDLPLDCTGKFRYHKLRLCFSIAAFVVVLTAAITALCSRCHCRRPRRPHKEGQKLLNH